MKWFFNETNLQMYKLKGNIKSGTRYYSMGTVA